MSWHKVPDDFTTCSCGRAFATKLGYDSHLIALHDAEPNPQENIPNDQENLRSSES